MFIKNYRSISTNIPSLAKSFANLSQPQCCGGRWLKAESKYVYGMQWKMSSKELRAPKFQSSKELRKPNRYKPNRCQWLFNADRVTDRSVVGVLGQQHMINRWHCLSPALLLPLSLSLVLPLSSSSLSLSPFSALVSYASLLCLFSCAANSIKQTIRESFITRAVGNPFFFSLRSSVVIKGSPL